MQLLSGNRPKLGAVLRNHAVENDLFFLSGIVKNKLAFTVTLFHAEHRSQLVVTKNSQISVLFKLRY